MSDDMSGAAVDSVFRKGNPVDSVAFEVQVIVVYDLAFVIHTTTKRTIFSRIDFHFINKTRPIYTRALVLLKLGTSVHF